MEWIPGGIFRRWVALMIDAVIISLISLPLSIWNYITHPMDAERMKDPMVVIGQQVPSILAGFFIQFLYNGWFLTRQGATPGKKIMGLKVVSHSDGTNISWVAVLARQIGKWFDLFFFIGYFMAFFRKDKRALHDFMAGSQVLEKL